MTMGAIDIIEIAACKHAVTSKISAENYCVRAEHGNVSPVNQGDGHSHYDGARAHRVAERGLAQFCRIILPGPSRPETPAVDAGTIYTFADQRHDPETHYPRTKPVHPQGGGPTAQQLKYYITRGQQWSGMSAPGFVRGAPG